MRGRLALALLALWSLTALPVIVAGARDESVFGYDAAEREVRARLVAGERAYDADVLAGPDGDLAAWLEHVPGAGDLLRLGRLGEEALEEIAALSGEPGRYARPRLTRDAAGGLWLSYEASAGGLEPWDVHARRVSSAGELGPPVLLSDGPANDVEHDAAAEPGGGLLVVWQSAGEGGLDVHARRVDAEGEPGLEQPVADGTGGDWHPRVAVAPDGRALVVWDAFTGESFDVLARWRIDGEWGPVRAVATGPRFQGRPQVAFDSGGRAWVAWESGARSWGGEHRERKQRWDAATAERGPLHRERALHLAALEPDGSLLVPREPVPMPRRDLALARDDGRAGVGALGVYYERPELAVDAQDRPWLVYRHYDDLQLGRAEPVVHHVEEGWRLFARALGADGWSPLVGLDGLPQRDGNQRLAVSVGADGLRAVWTTGRTDRRKDPRPRGLAGARWRTQGAGAPGEELLERRVPLAVPERAAPPHANARAEVGGAEYGLYLGDLHRHTDLSLCFPFLDGSLDDAYRYALDVARLDFLGITDHTRDIDRGSATGLLWWRCVKEVERHRVPGRFRPFYTYERSHRDTDHNVISLRPDVLRNFPPPLPDFWAEIDGESFTIPHNPLIGKLWEQHDDAKRPLIEVYQSLRDEDVEAGALKGLARGYHLGFIASSDHLTTSAAYACVWSPAGDREALFRSLQARRTYGATHPIELRVTCGERWMGERLAMDEPPRFQVQVRGTAPLERVELLRDGEVERTWTFGGEELEAALEHESAPVAAGESFFHVRVFQAAGGRAWASPIWVRREAR